MRSKGSPISRHEEVWSLMLTPLGRRVDSARLYLARTKKSSVRILYHPECEWKTQAFAGATPYLRLTSHHSAYAPLHTSVRELGLMNTHRRPAKPGVFHIVILDTGYAGERHQQSTIIDVVFIHWTLDIVRTTPTPLEPQNRRVYKLGE